MYDENPTVLPNANSGHVVPKFATNQIQTPIAIFYGGRDTLPDIQFILKNTPPLVACLCIDGIHISN